MAYGILPSQIGKVLSVPDLRELRAFYEIEPWGCETEDWRYAVLYALIANQWRDPKSNPITVEEMVPDRDGTRKERKRKKIIDLRTLDRNAVRDVIRAFREGVMGSKEDLPGEDNRTVQRKFGEQETIS